MKKHNFKHLISSWLRCRVVFALMLFFAGGISSTLLAQNQPIKVSGVVVDEQKEPLIGASVRIKDTTIGMLTDENGKFSLKAPSKASIIQVSYFGTVSQEFTVGSKTFFNIVLKEDNKMLDEVEVTAMGIERKSKSLTYATQKIDNEELMRVQDASFINSLQGKAAGLSITPNVGGAGGSSKILLRGSKSILGNNTPLIVIDGIPISNAVKNQQGIGGGSGMGYGFSTEGSDALSSINPDDIESVNILKGANAAALYGSAAANGVLMITTKKGKEGVMSVNITSNATFENPLLLPQLQNRYGAAVNVNTKKIENNSWNTDYLTGKSNLLSDMSDAQLTVSDNRLVKEPQNYIEDFFATGVTLNNSVSISGGSKNIQSYFSYGNTTSKGMIETNRFSRHTISFRQNYHLFKERLKVDVAINYVDQTTKNRPGGGTSLNPLFHLYTSPRNTNMRYFRDNYQIENGTWKSNDGSSKYLQLVDKDKGLYKWVYEPTDLKGPKQNWLYISPDQNNPYWLINMLKRKDKESRVYGYISGNVKIMDGLNAQGRFSIDRSKTTSIDERAATTQFPTAMIDYGIYGQWLRNYNEFYLDWMLSYNKTFGDYTIAANGGYSAHKITGTSQGMFENSTAYDYNMLRVPTAINLYDPRSGSGGSRSYSKSINWDEGLFLTTQLGYKDYLFVEGSYRRDWYRAFTQFRNKNVADNYGYFSFGANALLHEIVSLPSFWNHFKVRTSYSEVGNSIPNIMYAAQGVNLLTGAVTPSPYADFENPIPEVSKSFEAGFDVSFFRNSLNWDVTFYNTTMNNNYLIVGAGGKSKPVNTGVIRNRGVETSLSYAVDLAHDFIWRTGVNLAYNSNRIISTYKENGKEALISQEIGFGGKFQIRYKEGGRYGDLYATDFRRNEDGTIMLNDGKPMLSSDKFGQYVGNMIAPYQVGWNNTFTYKGVSLYFLIDGKIGGKVVSFTEAYLDRLGLSARTGEARLIAAQKGLVYEDIEGDKYPAMLLHDGQLAPIQKYYEGIGGDINATQYVYDATNFRLREISLGYTFADLLGKSKDLSLSLVARNLFFLYNQAPVDPDTSLSTQNGLGGFDIFNMPTARSVGFSVSLKF